MRKLQKITNFLFFLLVVTSTNAVSTYKNITTARPDAHAPSGVMLDHTHKKNEIMLSYRFMQMSMSGLRDGTNRLSNSDAHIKGFPVAPTNMETQMHMFGIMYAPHDKITLSLMGNYQLKKMDFVTKKGTPPRSLRGENFTNKTDGWGDISLNSLFVIYENISKIHLNFGLSIPTGEFSSFAYPMHHTSGTWDALVGFTWFKLYDNFSSGFQINAIIPLNENKYDFKFGSHINTTIWGALKLNQNFSLSTRIHARFQDKISGSANRIQRILSPPMVPENYGGTWVNIGLGINYVFTDKYLKNNRLSCEFIMPIYQNLNGPQLQSEYMLSLAWQKAW